MIKEIHIKSISTLTAVEAFQAKNTHNRHLGLEWTAKERMLEKIQLLQN